MSATAPVITITLGAPATGFGTTAATVVPAAILAALGAEAVRLVRNNTPSTRNDASTVSCAIGQDALAVTLTSATVA